MTLAKAFTFSTITEKQIARFWKKVNIGSHDKCWPWTGALSGYKGHQPYVQFGGGTLIATRLGWFIVHRADPFPLFVLHHCDNTVCCNPVHWFLGTSHENMIDKARKGRAGNVLTPAIVELIREQIRLGRTNRAIGVDFGVTYKTIYRIRRGEQWQHTQAMS